MTFLALPTATTVLPMPRIALGAGDTICSHVPDCSVPIGEALRLGFRHVDTAYPYGTQVAVGRALRSSGLARGDYFLTTKIPGPVGYAEALRTHAVNLKQLNLTSVDLLLMHYPCSEKWGGVQDGCGQADDEAARWETWRAMEHLHKSGQAAALGVSNFHLRHLRSLLANPALSLAPRVNQVEWHLGWHDDALLAYCGERSITLEAYSPLGGGGTTTGHNGGVALDDPVVSNIAKGHNASTAAVALRWSLQVESTSYTYTSYIVILSLALVAPGGRLTCSSDLVHRTGRRQPRSRLHQPEPHGLRPCHHRWAAAERARE